MDVTSNGKGDQGRGTWNGSLGKCVQQKSRENSK